MIWLLIAGMTLITFLNRYAFFSEIVQYRPGERVRRFLSYSSFAILTAIWTPIVFQVDFAAGVSHAGWDYLIAGTLAAVLSYCRIRSIVVVLLSAAVFFALRFFVVI